MNKRPLPLAAVLVFSLLASGCAGVDDTNFLGVRLAPCTVEGSPFATRPFKEWASYYHSTVDRVVQAHIDSLQGLGTSELKCTASTLLETLKPSQDLANLAKLLAPWRTPARLAKLSELHVGPVLLEFLRVYECSNLERARTIQVSVLNVSNGTMGTGTGSQEGWDRGEMNNEMQAQTRRIESELRLARTVTHRALSILGSLDDLRGISVEVECLKRASLDMRNVVGLAADASACLARVPGRASLRDLTTAL